MIKNLSTSLLHDFSPVEFETLKTYIEIHPKTGFIQHSKSFADISILFKNMPNDNFHLYVNYWSINNLPIQN